MSFAEPWLIGAAAAIAVLFALAIVAGERRTRAAALEYSSLPFLDAALGRGLPWTGLFIALWSAAILAAGCALARPSALAEVTARSGAVVLCIDTSGSMSSTDVQPSRSAAARDAAGAFVAGLPAATRVAVVAFASEAIPLGPLVRDRDAVRDQLDRIPAPNGATAIGSALAAAARLLPPGGRRAIVLVTDGVNNRGADPLEAARTLGTRGVTIYTVGIGTNGSGQIVPGTSEEAGLDEDALREIAREGNGSYARVADAAALRARLDALATTVVRERARVDLTEPFAVAAGVLAFAAALGAVALGRFP
jgi:Ca-activated chloride channel family protein